MNVDAGVLDPGHASIGAAHAAPARGARRAGHREVGRAEPRRRRHDAGRRGGRFAAAVTTGSAWLGVVAGALAGAALALIFAVLTLSLLANQVATGLALTLFGVGLAP